MTSGPMSPQQEYDFYADAANQQPQGTPRRRKERLSTPVPARFPAELLEEVKSVARADDRSRLGSAEPSSTNCAEAPERCVRSGSLNPRST